MKVQSWGRLSDDNHEVCFPHTPDELSQVVTAGKQLLAYGLGRSYGDVCLNPDARLINMTGLDKFRSFDSEQGILDVEAGASLRDIQRVFVPQGWSLPVTPGTQYVTVGGAIANDIHGKSHHIHGSFGHNVDSLTLLRTDGTRLNCSVRENAGFFAATIGGIGLTGVIESARLRLRKIPGPWMQTETLGFRGIQAFVDISNQSDDSWEHSVAWVDCLSGAEPRGLFMRGNYIARDGKEPPQRQVRFPFTPPFSLVNSVTLKPLNLGYRFINAVRPRERVQHVKSFLYPLDGISNWNRAYGRPGFFQYQSVLPPDAATEGTRAMLAAIRASSSGSFLAVLKRFGNQRSIGMLSFPRPGFTLAIDFPNRGDDSKRLFKRLDAIVEDCGGALYLSKDARMPEAMFQRSYPRQAEFQTFRDSGISSAMSRRLFGK